MPPTPAPVPQHVIDASNKKQKTMTMETRRVTLGSLKGDVKPYAYFDEDYEHIGSFDNIRKQAIEDYSMICQRGLFYEIDHKQHLPAFHDLFMDTYQDVDASSFHNMVSYYEEVGSQYGGLHMYCKRIKKWNDYICDEIVLFVSNMIKEGDRHWEICALINHARNLASENEERLKHETANWHWHQVKKAILKKTTVDYLSEIVHRPSKNNLKRLFCEMNSDVFY